MIIDCHGHYTTVPPEMEQYRQAQLANLSNLSKGTVPISDDQLRESLEGAQIKLQRERGTDVTFFSPRASAMAHHLGSAKANHYWAEHWNDLIYPLVYLRSQLNFPVSLGMRMFQTSHPGMVDYPRLMACAVMTLLPCVILFFSFQRLYIQGVVVTGVDK